MLGCHYEEQSDEVIRNLKNGLPRVFTHPSNDRKLRHGSLVPQLLKKNQFYIQQNGDALFEHLRFSFMIL